jgi:hypothetical protein
MRDDPAVMIRREARAARRLARLFRIERRGGFARWPAATVSRLVERRGALVDELLRLDTRRQSIARRTTADLRLAMGALAREVHRGEQHCQGQLAELGAELARRREPGATTGLRDGAGGQLLGSG